MDVTDLIDYNVELLDHHNPTLCFFHLDRKDPTVGFPYDSTNIFSHTYPSAMKQSPALPIPAPDDAEDLILRLRVGSHLARYLRHELENQRGFTSTVGISTNKLLSKLVGNVKKPKGQTTLLTPYNPNLDGISHVNQFLDDHEIGKIPGVGFKIAQKIRAHVLGRPAIFDAGLVYGGTREAVTVQDVRTFDGMGPKLLQSILDGPGVQKDLAERIWKLINGVDDTEVTRAKEVPQQISIVGLQGKHRSDCLANNTGQEDSYIRLDEIGGVVKELKMLSSSLITRMRVDLTQPAERSAESNFALGFTETNINQSSKGRWIAYPRSIRLSTRPRPPLNPDGTRSRTFARISKSGLVPSFVFNLSSDVEVLATRLVEENLLPLFRKLHPEENGWNLSLVNICIKDMIMSASDGGVGSGRDISEMFRRQDDTLKLWKVEDRDDSPDARSCGEICPHETDGQEPYSAKDFVPSQPNGSGSEDFLPQTQSSVNGGDDWDGEEDWQESGDAFNCTFCGAIMPAFAMVAHGRFHSLPE